MSPPSATAVAHSNIALIKYWGKSEASLNLPAVPSLSLTLDGLTTTTRVEVDSSLREDQIEIGGELVSGRERDRVVALLDRVRQLTSREAHARVSSSNDFPTAAGLASSASGFAALAVAAASAYGLTASSEMLSALARQSSASAARSLFGGFVNLGAGASAATPLAPPGHWDLNLLVAVTEAGKKPLGSTEAMQRTMRESPYYAAWVEHAPRLHAQAEKAVLARDFTSLGGVMEQSTLMMHASMWATAPAIVFLTEASLALIHRLRALRSAGLECYFTIDAGPHVKILVERANVAALVRELRGAPSILRLIECAPGPAARLVQESG